MMSDTDPVVARPADARACSGAWWQCAAFYQIYPLSFQDSNGDGKGDLPGILARIDHLAWLGIDAVWLSPIYPSPMADFGYDIADFEGVDPTFGTLEDFDRLLAALHARSIRLVLDFVPNHTSIRHPWFEAARSSRADPHRDWYVWRDPAAGGGPPNNWLSRFGGSAWEWDEASGQYYYHAFLKEQPDLNWRNPAVRAAMARALRFWLRRGVDGFRIDAAAVLAEDEQLRDDPPNPEANSATPPPERLKRVHTNYRPEVLDWLAELRRVVDDYPGRVLLAEVDTEHDHITHFYGTRERPIVHLPLNARLLDTDWNASTIAHTITEYLGMLPEEAWPDWLFGSHDKKRIARLVGPAQARVAAMLALTLRGTPIFFAGDELGMSGARVAFAPGRDPFERLVPGYGLNRDPQRSPMQWDASAHAGFSRATPWLPPADDYPQCNAVAQRADPCSILHLYRQLLALRHAQPALTLGGCERVRAQGDVLAYERAAGAARLGVFLNIGSANARASLDGRSARILLSTTLQRTGEHCHDRVRLAPDEGVVMAIDRTQ